VSTKLYSVTLVSSLLLACGPGIEPADDEHVSDAALTPTADAAPGTEELADAAFGDCVEAIYEADQGPAALMVLLDRSTSMSENNKWTFAAQAIVQALDQDVFDSVSVGLYAAPTGEVTGPDCIYNLPVACLVPAFPQVDLQLAGNGKSTAPSGVRHDIKGWLTANSPLIGVGDASPLYAAAQAAIGTLQAWPEDGKRMLLVVTDGSISCNEFSSRPGFGDCNGCLRDWEDPRNIATLLAEANANAVTPIESFVIGVPGADTYDASACSYPPYHMRLALSAIAYAGSPAHVPADCDGTTFTESGGDPSVSCHFDMTTGGFNTQAIADTISYVRGETMGCLYDLPEPPPGSDIDLTRVNVEYTADGNTVQLAKRSDSTDPCTTNGCWDYTLDTRVELIGKACTEVKQASTAEVHIVTGCTTIIL